MRIPTIQKKRGADALPQHEKRTENAGAYPNRGRRFAFPPSHVQGASGFAHAKKTNLDVGAMLEKIGIWGVSCVQLQ